MKKRTCETPYKGSLTIAAASIMAMVLVSEAVVIREAGRIHDETKGAMLLQEAVEKGRHEKGMELGELSEKLTEASGLMLRFPSWEMGLREQRGKLVGSGKGGEWQYSIEMEPFRPESFLRAVTLLELLGEKDED